MITQEQNQVHANVKDLIQQVERGDMLEAFEQYYADDVTLVEHDGEIFDGKASAREHEKEFMNSIDKVTRNEATGHAVEGNRAFIHWRMDFRTKDGTEMKIDQVSMQEWKNGQIAREQFFYDSKTAQQ